MTPSLERILGIPNCGVFLFTDEVRQEVRAAWEGSWSRQGEIVHSEVGVVAEEALKVAVAQEGSVSAIAVIA